MTLEKGKSYGQEVAQQQLVDKARTRLNNPTPHQAPQRERVSRAAVPGNRDVPSGRRRGGRHWKSLLRPDVNMGVPQLMMILEPNVVWEHTQAYVAAVGKEIEATITPGEFFEGWHKGGRKAHGVYEGSYWELLGDCEDLMDMLRKMSKAPALLEEPPLELPPPPALPRWEDFKPELHVIPQQPTLPPLKLPPFRAPILETDVPFLEPEYLPVPSVPQAPKEDPTPSFLAPELLKLEALQEPQYVDPAPPVLPEAPRAPSFGVPRHGHDWTGERPYQLDLPTREPFLAAARKQLLSEEGEWTHPPNPMPPLPELEKDQDILRDLDLEPIPKLELAWMGGPEPDPPYASVPASPAVLSRAGSRPPSRPASAVKPPTRPQSAVRTPPVSASPPPSRPRSSVGQPGVPPIPFPGSEPSSPERQPSTTVVAAEPTPPLSARHSVPTVAAEPSRATPEQAAWAEALSIPSEASGAPKVWCNFAAPFADLPPVMMPPRPEPGREPAPEDFPHEALEDLPAFVAAAQHPLPAYEEPQQHVPSWVPPSEPRPIGFLRGTAPVIICDVSGTMNPRQQGRFREMKRCAVELLDPEGELATAAVAFDVITFCSGAWSWAAGYGERMGLLASSQVLYSGRQVGGKANSKTPGGGDTGTGSRSGSPGRSTSPGRGGGTSGRQLVLQPTTPDMLTDAQRWVANWPDAVGSTHLLTAFNLADHHPGANCWYVLSDGMAHDQQACVDWLAARASTGLPVPVIHAVGFIPADANPDSAGERFLRTLAELTGGSYQRYTPEIAKIWQPGQGFVRYNMDQETLSQRTEREWAERQLRAERRKNIRLGVFEPLDVTMERVAALHASSRVAPALRDNAAAIEAAQRRHAAAVATVEEANRRAEEDAQAAYEEATEAVRLRNQAKVDAAKQAYLEAQGDWEADYLSRLQEWEDTKAMLEQQREEQLAVQRAAAAAGAPSSGGASRPTSGTRYAAARRRTASATSLLSPRLAPSEQRAAFAAAEYDAAMGLEQHADKLSPSSSPYPSRPVSAVRPLSAARAAAGGSGSGGVGRPRSAKPVPGGEDPGAAQEYLESIAEDLAEASAPLDAVFGAAAGAGGAGAGAGARQAAVAGVAETDDDGLDDVAVGGVDTSRGWGRGGSRRGSRDQDSSRTSRSDRAASSSSLAAGASGGLPPRPTSGAGGGRQSRPPSARPSARPSAARPLSAGGSMPWLPEGSVLLPPVPQEGSAMMPPPLPEPSAPLVPLQGEASEEFKRRIFPAVVVEELDAANAARLAEIRTAWEDLVAADLAAAGGRRLAVAARNAARLREYEGAVQAAYAQGLLRDVVFGVAVRTAANKEIMDQAEAAYQAELARVLAENERLRALHTAEVEEKRAREEAHAQAYTRWEDSRAAALATHEGDKVQARQEHDANVERLRAEWQAKKEETDALNAALLAEAEKMHEALVEAVKEANRQHKAEHAELLRQRKEVEAANLSRMAEAKTAHKVRVEARAAENERLIKQAAEEHQDLCVRLAEEYEEARVAAEADHAELCAFLRAANEQLTDEARRRFQEAIQEVQEMHEAECAAAREAHEREMQRVKRFNQEIWPKVHVARIAQAELGRVQAFAEHIRFCANKFEMGVNLMPNTPNYDRVVEMQALTEALARAFPDMASNALPWPEHERREEPGTGWVAAPPTRPLTYRDPAEIISRIAQGKAQPGAVQPGVGTLQPTTSRTPSPRAVPVAGRLSSGGTPDAYGQGAAAATDAVGVHGQGQGQGQPTRPTALARPLSAGRARFANVLPEGRPISAIGPGRVEAWGAAAISAISSPGGGRSRPQSAYANPSALRRSNTLGLRASSPRGPTSGLGAAAAAAATAAAASSARPPRPATARPASGRAYQPQAQPTVPQQQAPGTIPARPRSAGPAPRPARVAVDVVPLQASIARSKAQAGAHTLNATQLAGFGKDVPRLRYPEVDVPMPLTVTR